MLRQRHSGLLLLVCAVLVTVHGAVALLPHAHQEDDRTAAESACCGPSGADESAHVGAASEIRLTPTCLACRAASAAFGVRFFSSVNWGPPDCKGTSAAAATQPVTCRRSILPYLRAPPSLV